MTKVAREYLGEFEIEYFYKSDYPDELDYLDDDGDCVAGFIYNDTLYTLDQFMRVDHKLYHGVMGVCNWYGYGIRLSDCNTSLKLWLE